MDIKSSKPVTLSEVKDLLSKRKKDGELGYEQSETLAYCEKFVKEDAKASRKLADRIMKENGKINEEIAARLVDIKPRKPDTLKAILLKDKIELSEEELNAIFNLLQ